MFKKTLRPRLTCLACQHFSFHAKKSLARERPFSLAVRVVSLFSCLSRLAPSVTRVVICVSRAFCSTKQEKRETARSLSRYSFVTHSIDRTPRDRGLARSAYSINTPQHAFGRRAVRQRGYCLRLLIFKMANNKVHLGQMRSEEIVYSRFIKISLG